MKNKVIENEHGDKLIKKPSKHYCSLPDSAEKGDKFICHCGKKYKCKSDKTRRGNHLIMRADWRRIYFVFKK